MLFSAKDMLDASPKQITALYCLKMCSTSFLMKGKTISRDPQVKPSFSFIYYNNFALRICLFFCYNI